MHTLESRLESTKLAGCSVGGIFDGINCVNLLHNSDVLWMIPLRDTSAVAERVEELLKQQGITGLNASYAVQFCTI